MRYFLLTIPAVLISLLVQATGKDSTVHYNLPDSVKAISFLATINVQGITAKKEAFAGIKTDLVKLALETDRNKKEVVFEFPSNATVKATGLTIKSDEKGELKWEYDWATNESYKLLLAVATDSAGNFSLYSGYIWLPKDSKWKLIGTCRIEGQWSTIKNPAAFISSGKKNAMQATVSDAWCQRNNGSWKKLDGAEQSPPVVNVASHIDSLQQFDTDKKIIEEAIAAGKTDVKNNVEGVYYKIIKEGTGRQVDINDTVTVYYKLTLLNDTAIVDQAKDKPATFPLKRLIKGWQLGVPLSKVGGKIKLVIPSAHAYSIRTRAAKIPPNSILVFDIEVVDASK